MYLLTFPHSPQVPKSLFLISYPFHLTPHPTSLFTPMTKKVISVFCQIHTCFWDNYTQVLQDFEKKVDDFAHLFELSKILIRINIKSKIRICIIV